MKKYHRMHWRTCVPWYLNLLSVLYLIYKYVYIFFYICIYISLYMCVYGYWIIWILINVVATKLPFWFVNLTLESEGMTVYQLQRIGWIILQRSHCSISCHLATLWSPSRETWTITSRGWSIRTVHNSRRRCSSLRPTNLSSSDINSLILGMSSLI